MPRVAQIKIIFHLPVPVGHPRHGGSLTGVPLWCGRPWQHDTPVTYAPERVTCGRCLKLHERYQEEQRYQHLKDRKDLLAQLG